MGVMVPPRKLNGWDGGGDKMHSPPGETALTKHLVTWAAWTWEAHKTQVQPSLCLCGVPENLNLRGLDLGSQTTQGPLQTVPQQSKLEPEKCRQGKRMSREQGQTQYCQDTVSTPHTSQWYLFAVFLPPHSTNEQVSLNKWPPSPTCVRAEIRHWRNQQTEEDKINRGNHFGSDRYNRLKPCSYHRLH